MKWLNASKMRLVLIGCLAAFVLGGESASADFIWGPAVNLGPNVNSSSNDAGPSISADGLTLYFSSDRPGGLGGYDLWLTTRATIDDDWGPAVNLGQPPNSQYSYWEPSISLDELTLYFSDGHSPQFGNPLPGGLSGEGDIWMVTRASIHDGWGEPINLGPGVNSQHAIHPSISSDSLSLYFQSHRSGSLGHCDIMMATRESTSNAFGDPVFLKNVNTGGADWTPDISADDLTLCFMRNPGPTEIWASKRLSTDDDFGAPIKLPLQVNMPGYDNGLPNLSADGTTLYFMSSRPGGFGGWDLWQVSIEPVVDFNDDGRTNFKDFCELANYWSADESSVDIAPLPLGDNKVDYKDLAVFTDYWLKGNPPGQASNPYPANYIEEVDINVDLSWTAGIGAASYDVYFGMSSPGTFQGNQSDTTFDPGTMVHGSTYYWRIDAVSAWGKTTGTVWSFTTVYSDLQAKNPNPSNGAYNVSITADLSWTAGVGATSHDLYFGTSNPPPFIHNQATTTFDPGAMDYSTVYYWRIDEVDAYGTTAGTGWSFTTVMSPPPP
jgi:Tol biopolymer transport system component